MKRKILKEDNDNEYAKAINEVEALMRKNKVSLMYIGGFTLVKIKDLEYRMRSMEFPRSFDEDTLEIY